MNNIKEILLDKHESFFIFPIFWQRPMIQVHENIFRNS